MVFRHSLSSRAFRWPNGGGAVKYQQMSQHLIFRPRGLYIDRPLGTEVGGGDVDLSGRRGVLRFEGLVGFGFERCVVSGDTH